MPWIKDEPEYYRISDFRLWDEEHYIYAKKKRAEITRWREVFLEYQKYFTKIQDFETAKFFSTEAKEQLKTQRGWDACVKFIEYEFGQTNEHPAANISEEIAPYVDLALAFTADLIGE